MGLFRRLDAWTPAFAGVTAMTFSTLTLDIETRPNSRGYRSNLHAYRTTATAVARLRLETPAPIGMDRQWSAEAIIDRLRPSRSAPKARMAFAGIEPCRRGSPPGSTATSNRSQLGRAAVRATGRAYCKPTPAIKAVGCQGSWGPVVMTPAAPTAAATRIARADVEEIPGILK